ncbi:TetR/AcrR family transcriptional regulator [Nocardia sp. NPDC057440]|uniref:TetR/AcrR family transcriptional regulator n=1 Tax=Nocardia sp. NPDC057440 TaxID=3346134 RepID=UPI00366ED443
MTDSESATKRANRAGPYHHGDLRNALVRAAAELAETGGPEAVTVRAAARLVGVTPTAAYRHFTNHDQLLGAAQAEAQQSLFGAMSAGVESLGPEAHAILRLNAVGRGYIAFARAEPGLFRTAFCETGPVDGAPEDSPAFNLLSTLLDELVEIGYMDPAHRPDAEIAAWAMVHGLAALMVEGPIPGLDDAAREQAITHTLAVIQRGLATGPKASG